MAKLQQYRVSASSLSPMLQNPMTDEVLDELLGGKGARKGAQIDLTVEQRAQKKLCLGPDGEFGFPSNYLQASLVEAGREVPLKGKTNISTATSSKLPAFMSIVPDIVTAGGDGFIPFLDQTVMWVPDKRRGVLAANKAAVAIVRPKFPTWAFEVTVEIDLEQIAVDKIRSLFEIAGRQTGLGDFRPSKRGEFGRFTITDFVEMQQALKKAA